MSKKILFFDTETNGLPINWKASYTEVDNWPRVIQMGWILTDESGNILSKHCFLIKPDGWMVPTEEFWVKNGFTQAKNESDGVPIMAVLDLFMKDKLQADIIVAHNLSFDHHIVWAEYIRNGMTPRSGIHKICTMQKSTKFCAIPNANGRGGYKWPQLIELYTKIFKKGFDKAHDAMADVTACMECFFALVGHGVISLEIPQEKLV